MLGQTISHFQILDKLGEGGMGVVYRARDLRLDRAVALKFLPRHLSENNEEKERFIQEAKAASALDHPNICTIHEIDETEDGQLFIAMAAYEGETIKQKIRQGPVPVEEVIELGIQMTAGLAAAHDRGIIHRDVKPANFMVTPDRVVKILDFGLSKLTNAPTSLTQTGTLMGTAAYMSPEQVQGEVVDQQTDVWALGVVLYELATGAKPFRGSNDLSTLYRIVHQEPDSRTDSGRLPTQLRGILRRALAKERDRRYATITELQADLERLRADTQSASLPPFLRRVIDPAQTRAERMRRLQLLTAVLAVGLAVLVLSVLQWMRRSTTPAVPSNLSTAWLGFFPASEEVEPDWRGLALAELVLSEVPEHEGLRWIRPTLPPETKLRAEREGARGFPEALLRKLHDAEGIERVVVGFFDLEDAAGENPRIKVELWVQKTHRGAPVQRLSAVGRSDDLLELGGRMSTELARALGGSALPPGEARAQAAADLPEDPEVAQLLAQARERLRQLDAPAARRLAEQGLAGDPNRGSLHAVLTGALLLLGQELDARDHALAAVAAARKLPRKTRLLYTSSLREVEGELAGAAALLRLLSNDDGPPPLFPIDLERLDRDLRLANLLADDQTKAAQTVLEPYQQVIPDDPRLLLVEAEIARQDSDNRRQRELGARAAAQAQASGEELLLARARFFEGEALRRLNQLDEAEAALEAARELYVRAGHVRGEADMIMNLGNVSWDRQDLAAAQTFYEQAARLYGSIRYDRLRNRALGNQALVLWERGSLQAALEIQQEVRGFLRSAGDLMAESIALVTIGELTLRLGRFSEAEEAFKEAYEVAMRSGNPIMISSALSANGEFLLLRGDLTQAEHKLREAIAIQEQKGDLQYAAEARSSLAQVRHYQGDLKDAENLNLAVLGATAIKENPSSYTRARRGLGEVWQSMGRHAQAREAFEDVLAIQDRLGSLRAAETRLSLALWWLENGKPSEAAALAGQVLDDVARRGEKLMAARAHWLLAETSLARGDLAAAQRQVDAGREQLKDVDCPVYSWPLDLTTARIEAARGDLSKARTSLQSLLAATTKASFLELQLETRLLLAQLDFKETPTRGERVRLEQLATEAAQKGFGRVANNARQSLIDIPLH